MRLTQFIFRNKKYTIIISTLIVVFLTFLILQVFVLKYDLAYEIKWILSNGYLFLLESSANPFLHLMGSGAFFENQNLYLNGIPVRGFLPEVRYEVIVLILIAIVWLIRSSLNKKVAYTALFLLSHFFANTLNVIAAADRAASKADSQMIMAITSTAGLLVIFTLFFIWYRNHKDQVLSRLSRFKLNIKLLENDWLVIMTVYGFIIVSGFLIEIFEFKLWITLIFNTAKKVLQIFGYEAVVDNLRLIGPNGKILMSKACLGFQLMLLFTIMILLTGDNRKARWKYIITGIVFLNIINVLRFVLLFIHLQKHGDYLLSIEAHNLYNLVTYIIVFLLWIIWFEVFADAKKGTGSGTNVRTAKDVSSNL